MIRSEKGRCEKSIRANSRSIHTNSLTMWKYTPLLNVMIQMLVTMGLGGVMGKLKIFKADEFSPLAVLFIFFVALPCLVIKVRESHPAILILDDLVFIITLTESVVHWN